MTKKVKHNKENSDFSSYQCRLLFFHIFPTSLLDNVCGNLSHIMNRVSCYEIYLLKLLQSSAKAPLTHRPPHFPFISLIHQVCLPTPERFIFSLPCLPPSVCNKLNEILRHFPGAEAVCQAALTGPGGHLLLS